MQIITTRLSTNIFKVFINWYKKTYTFILYSAKIINKKKSLGLSKEKLVFMMKILHANIVNV